MSNVELVRLIGTNDGNEIALRLGKVIRELHTEGEISSTLRSLIQDVAGNTMEQHSDLLSQEAEMSEYQRSVTDAATRTIEAIITSGYGRGATARTRRRRAAA